MDLGLAGQTALVTGGSRGIGLAVAVTLADEGARVALLGRDPDTLAAAAERVGTGTVVVRADTTDDAQVRAAVEEAATALGRLDMVVNCAASTVRVKDVPTMASTTINVAPPSRATSGRTTSTGAENSPRPATPTATRTTCTTVTAS